MIGRFQPFHKGHLNCVEYILDRHEKIYIGIGSALDSHTLRNPFTLAERIKMIMISLEESSISCDKYLLIPIPDSDIHTTWVSLVETLVPDLKKISVIYTNEPLTRRLFIENGYNVEPLPFYKREIYSGEEFRKRVINNENWQEIVTPRVAEYLLSENLINRIIDLCKRDKI